MPKITQLSNVKSKKIVIDQTELGRLAQAGTKEAIAKIEAYIRSEKDNDKKMYAKFALEECERFYYQPRNKKEEEAFDLCRLINKYKRRIDGLRAEEDRIKAGLNIFELEKKVHEQVLIKNKDKKSDWQYNCLDDFVFSDRKRLEEIADDIAYKTVWVEAAEKLIANTRYKGGISERHLGHYDFADDLYKDDGSCDCCDNGECPDCQGENNDSDVFNGVPF